MRGPNQRVELPRGGSWPLPTLANEETESVEHKLAHCPDTMTHGDQLFVASIIHAYSYLISQITPEAAAEVNQQMRDALREDHHHGR